MLGFRLDLRRRRPGSSLFGVPRPMAAVIRPHGAVSVWAVAVMLLVGAAGVQAQTDDLALPLPGLPPLPTLGRAEGLLPGSSTAPDRAARERSLLREGDSDGRSAAEVENFLLAGPERWTSEEGLGSSLQIILLLTVISLAPAIMLMTTSFVRIIIVLGILRQAIGTQSLPPSQVITALAMFLTILIMTPVWTDVYENAVVPYTEHEITLEQAWERGLKPIRGFMITQIQAAGNSDEIWMFYDHLPPDTPIPESYEDVPIQILLPAYMLSELKIAFLIGFQIYLPFLILDVVIASFTISMGMMMLPPNMISLPFKIMLFVLVDGWSLVAGMLMTSFNPI